EGSAAADLADVGGRLGELQVRPGRWAPDGQEEDQRRGQDDLPDGRTMEWHLAHGFPWRASLPHGRALDPALRKETVWEVRGLPLVQRRRKMSLYEGRGAPTARGLTPAHLHQAHAPGFVRAGKHGKKRETLAGTRVYREPFVVVKKV